LPPKRFVMPLPHASSHRLLVALALLGRTVATAHAQPKNVETPPAASPAATPAATDETLRSAARALGEEGLKLYDEGNFAAAADKLARADEIVRLPTTGLYVARALAKSGKLVEASEKYLAVTKLALAADATEQHRTAQKDAERERAELVPRIPSLEIVVGGDLTGATVVLDGRTLPSVLVGVKIPANPGTHTIEAQKGNARASQTITLAEGTSARATLDRPTATATAVANAPTEPKDDGHESLRPLALGGWIGLGVGGAALVAGGVLGGLTLAKESDLLEQGCSDGVCPPALAGELDGYAGLRGASMGLLYGGGALAALGVGALLLDPILANEPAADPPGATKTSSLRLIFGPTGLGVAGRF
jgi:hypothetical protein